MSEGKNRNKRCSCGSGKKFKNCCFLNRKTRTTSITVDMGRPVAIDAVRVTP
ncbi:SEC-C metal-binding domain-containing protein [Pelotalea chapellei]|uniref:SEC-C domain-containing protein n=1 Tax=Pelotalea chapellei TaxID=44671 RepID=A0ABS5UB85_9BACT|nr:SEC-C domain-containing protein [Pelotalea chapellei]